MVSPWLAIPATKGSYRRGFLTIPKLVKIGCFETRATRIPWAMPWEHQTELRAECAGLTFDEIEAKFEAIAALVFDPVTGYMKVVPDDSEQF